MVCSEVKDMPKLTLEVPSDVVDALRFPPEEIEGEIRRELALALYRRGVLALGKARVLAQMSRWQFEQLLGERRVPRHYTASDLAEDIRYAHGDL
jgi:predicted HTH domain antitoxin